MSTGEHVVASLAWDGTGSRTILYRRPTNSYYSGNADWSPDGRMLAFGHVTGPISADGTHIAGRIFVLTISTGEVKQLIPEAEAPALAEYSDSQVAWSRGASSPVAGR